MKKRTLILAAMLSMGMAGSMIATTRSSHSEVMTKEADGTYIINTTTLCKDVKGFRGNTPLSIYIKKGKIVEIKPLANKETPNYFNKVRQGLLNKWNGMKASYCPGRWSYGSNFLQQSCEGECKTWHCLLLEKQVSSRK